MPIRPAMFRHQLARLTRRGFGDPPGAGWPACATNWNPQNSLLGTLGYSGVPNFPSSPAPAGHTWFVFPQGNILLADSPACPGNSGPGCLNGQGCYIPQINAYVMPASQYAVYAGQVQGSNLVNATNQTLNVIAAPAAPAPAATSPGGAKVVTSSAAPPIVSNNVRVLPLNNGGVTLPVTSGGAPAAASCFALFGASDTCLGPVGILTGLAGVAAALLLFGAFGGSHGR